MKIGDRNYLIKSSGFWINMPSAFLVLNIWTESKDSYLLAEPIPIENPQELIDEFILKFNEYEVDIIDSTLLEHNEESNLKELFIRFNSETLTEISEVKLRGKLISDEEITATIKTKFEGFEIWKDDHSSSIKKDMEDRLRKSNINFKLIDDDENGIIYLKIN